MITTLIRFAPAYESEVTADGWVLSWSENADDTETEERFETITLLLARVQDLFSSDAEINDYFLARASADVLTAESAAVASALSAMRTAEGLDATI